MISCFRPQPQSTRPGPTGATAECRPPNANFLEGVLRMTLVATIVVVLQLLNSRRFSLHQKDRTIFDTVILGRLLLVPAPKQHELVVRGPTQTIKFFHVAPQDFR